MDYIKEAFNKVKQDINLLKEEFNNLKNELRETRELMINLCENVQEMTCQMSPAHQQIIQTNTEYFPANDSSFKPLKTQNQPFSTGNDGVPADRQTNQQTDRQEEDSIENAVEILKSLDTLKKEIYKKFKRLTEQEWLVFSTIYQFDEKEGYSDYQLLAEKLKLTESSIRDYISKLIKKGIPIDKVKLNNKNIRLNVSQNLKKIASLSTLVALRDL